MRVMCIDGIKAGTKGTAIDSNKEVGLTVVRKEEEIHETVTYTVVVEEKHFGAIYYELAECPPDMLYHSERFVVLPDQESEAINEQEHEAIIYQR